MIKTYSELRRIDSFEDRYEYLRVAGTVGKSTFGYERYLNQILYNSGPWRSLRNEIITRDKACDLGISGRDIRSGIIVHHIMPITIEDIEFGRDCVYDPNNLICTCLNTHNAIHYGNASMLAPEPKDRKKGDTTLWRTEY